jgi:hypothetical protein
MLSGMKSATVAWIEAIKQWHHLSIARSKPHHPLPAQVSPSGPAALRLNPADPRQYQPARKRPFGRRGFALSLPIDTAGF